MGGRKRVNSEVNSEVNSIKQVLNSVKQGLNSIKQVLNSVKQGLNSVKYQSNGRVNLRNVLNQPWDLPEAGLTVCSYTPRFSYTGPETRVSTVSVHASDVQGRVRVQGYGTGVVGSRVGIPGGNTGSGTEPTDC